jgi:hypothetical protein
VVRALQARRRRKSIAQLGEPIWEYDYKTLAKDLSAHLVYGLATAATDQLL